MNAPQTTWRPRHPGFAAIERLTDGTGIMQHSRHSVPDPNHGYCLDDNARALILMHRRRDLPNTIHDRWTKIFSDFVERAWNPERCRFRNFMSYEGEWLEAAGSEDSWGRAMWALGVTAAEARSAKLRTWAHDLFNQFANHLLGIESPRAMAFCILGAAGILNEDPENRRVAHLTAAFASRLAHLASVEARPDWTWFERVLAYDNCRLPEALLGAGRVLQREEFTVVGLSTLNWIVSRQTAPEGHFRAVGSANFGREYEHPSPWDQQPLEAQGMIEACAAAFAATKDPIWLAQAEKAHAWFDGSNDGLVSLVDYSSGECYDGLTPNGPNLNRGAESLLAFHLASFAMAELRARAIAP